MTGWVEDKELALHVLFVCTGNVCRSPSAERLAAAYGARAGVPDLATSSAGIRAVIGQPIHPDASRVLKKLGGNPSGFTARQFTPKIALDADLILVMTTAHRDAVLEAAPSRLRQTFTLGEAAQLVSLHGAERLSDLAALLPHVIDPPLSDVPDPIGLGPEVFELVGRQIAALLPPVLELCRRSVD